jgi:glycosyltransferase involved in cell wall biosynthesis
MTAYRRKRRTIHNALPPAVERLIATLVANKGEGRAPGRKIIATGRLVPQKNYPVLIRAAEHLRDAAIEVVGSGPDEAALRGLDVGSRVRFLGQCTREAALARLAAADVFVQPSLFEGHSLGLIEAAKFGLPLVVSNVPVQIEGVTAGDGTLCGIAVDPHDAVGLAAVLQKLLDDPDHYRYWADRARTLATWSSFETQLAAYRDLASNGTITAGAGMRAAPGIVAASPHGSAR